MRSTLESTVRKTATVLALVAALAAVALPAQAGRKGTNPVICLTNPLACV